MPLDPKTAVIVGVGQISHRATGLDDALSPSELMAEAIRRSATDAGLASVPDPSWITVVSTLSWRAKNPAADLAKMLGISPRATGLSTAGGNSPQSLVNTAAREINAGSADLVIMTGGEAWRTLQRARKQGVTVEWNQKRNGQERAWNEKDEQGAAPDRIFGEELEMNHAHEMAMGIYLPVQVYPMFETAIRAKAGRSVSDHAKRISELWSRFSQVASTNPYAWIQKALTPEQIRTPGDTNRMIGFPYPKYMNSNNDVDQGAAIIMCSVEKARSLGIAEDRWVFPHSGTDCHEHKYISNRWTFAETPAVELGGRMALQMAGLTIDDIDIVDLYSCFPSAVQLGAQSLGLDIERQLTRTGGLSFAGGPWNNYVMHSIATVVGELRDRPGQKGLVWANGGYATKHAFGVYSTTPPTDGTFKYAYPQDEIDAMPRRELAEGADGSGDVTVEAYSVMHDRDGQPELGLAACLTADGRRTWGKATDRDLAAAMCEGEWVGRRVRRNDEAVITAS
jgi:acetyl-CoA C-acetyltransferase